MSVKNPLTPAGIEPATFRFVAQYLNHCATAVPESTMVQKISVENVIPCVLHNLGIIIVQYGNGQFCGITTRFMVSANNTESGGFSSHCIYINL